ncbi:MAG: sle, partial [Marmoricola sp.]|nr:sle [Marmoricola sp.]
MTAVAAVGGVRDGINPNAVSCASGYSLDFEQFNNADYTVLDGMGSINGFVFAATSPGIWRSIRYYNSPRYVTQALGGAWLDFPGTSGTISFANGSVSSFSLLGSINSSATLDAYDAAGHLLATAGPGGPNIDTGTVSEYRVAASAAVIDHVVFTIGEANREILDMLCANGAGYTGVPLTQTFGNGTCNCDAPKQFHTDRPVNTATGALTEHFTDISLPGPGVDFKMTRAYTSADPTSGPMGPGWTFGYNASLAFVGNDVVVRGEDGQQLYFTAPASGTTYLAPPGTTATLTGSPSTGWTFTKQDQSTLQFNPAGRLSADKDRLGQGLAFTYSGTNLATATDAAGRVVTFNYTSGLLTQVSLADGRNVQYGYTGGHLSSVTDMRGKISTLAYDTGGRLASITDPNGHYLFQTTYNSAGRVTQQSDPRGKITTFGWNPSTQTATRTDPRGKTWTEMYSGNVLVWQIDPLGNATNYAYDQHLNRTSITDARGKTTKMSYDAAGNMLTRTGPAPSSVTESWTYTPFNAVATYINGRGKTTTYEYFPNELLKKKTDPLGRVTNYTWTANGLPNTITDPRSKATTFGYDAAGDRTSTLSPEGNLTSYAYDAYGRMTSVVTARGNVSGANPADYKTTYTYNANNQLLVTTDPLGHGFTNAYDDAGNLTSVTDADGKVTTYSYNADNRVTTVTDPRGAQKSTVYDDAGNVLSVDGPAGTTSYSYDDVNRVATMLTPRGNVTGATPANFTWTYAYDGNGNQISTSHPTAGTTLTGYDERNRPVSVTDAHGKVTATTYTADDLVATVTDPLSRVTSYGYDDADQKTTMTDAAGKVTTYGYDDSGNKTSQTTPLGNKTTWAYNGDGHLVTSVDPRGNVTGGTPSTYTTTKVYDPEGHLKTTTDPLGDVTTYAYDRVGNLTSSKDARNNTTTYGYDVLNRLTSLTDPLGKTTTYGYDADSHLTTRTDANTHLTTYTYDLAGRVTQKTNPVGTWKYTYDADGNITQTETAAGVATSTTGDGTITTTYDPLDRPTNIGYSDATPGVAYTYDELRRTGMTDNAVSGAPSEYYGYDDAGELTSVTRGTGSSAPVYSYAYDVDGRLTTRTIPDGTGSPVPTRTVTQTWDADSRPTSATNAGAAAVSASYTYDAAGNRTGTTFGNTVTESRIYDAADRLTAQNTTSGLSTISGVTLTLDPNGNPTTIARSYSTTTGGELYTYDADNRLTDVCWSSTCLTGLTQASDFTYDNVGNRLTEKINASNYSGTVTSTYNAADQLTQSVKPAYLLTAAVTTTYGYDANGNQTSQAATGGTTTTYGYDLANRIKSATTGAATTNYTYDGTGNRLAATTGTATTNYTWDKNNPLPELTSEITGTTSRRYIDDPNGDPLALINPGTGAAAGAQYLHPNGTGSIG